MARGNTGVLPEGADFKRCGPMCTAPAARMARWSQPQCQGLHGSCIHPQLGSFCCRNPQVPHLPPLLHLSLHCTSFSFFFLLTEEAVMNLETCFMNLHLNNHSIVSVYFCYLMFRKKALVFSLLVQNNTLWSVTYKLKKTGNHLLYSICLVAASEFHQKRGLGVSNRCEEECLWKSSNWGF